MKNDIKNKILITCSPKLSPYLEKELTDLGHEIDNSHSAGVEITATLKECYYLNLRLRTAFNVLYLVNKFNAKNADQLYQRIKDLAWEHFIPEDEYISIVPKVDNPTIDNTMYPALKVKDAIADRLMEEKGKRPDSGPDRDNIVIYLYWKNDDCWIYLNTSGRKLADRNYRKIPHTAPMQETLAAAVIMETGYDGTTPFISPMTGSGTLAIEAALIATNRAPGLLRNNFGFMHFKDFDNDLWQDIRHEVKKESNKNKPKIIATDINPNAIKAAKQNAKTAGVDHLIEFDTCDFAQTKIPDQEGIIILNPEYGQRLGETKPLEKTYARIGDFFKQKCPGYTGYIFTGNLDLAKKVGLRTSKRTIFYNGSIECRLLEYELYKGSKK